MQYEKKVEGCGEVKPKKLRYGVHGTAHELVFWVGGNFIFHVAHVIMVMKV